MSCGPGDMGQFPFLLAHNHSYFLIIRKRRETRSSGVAIS